MTERKAERRKAPRRVSARRPEPDATREREPLAGVSRLLGLQKLAGNAAVAGAVQRIAVQAPSRQETLFNRRNTPGQAGAAVFGSATGRTMDMSRGGSPEAVTVTVRIRFIQQARALSAPDASGNQFPVDSGPITAIPAGDARRPFAQDICDKAPSHWTGRAVLVGTRAAASGIASLWDSDPGGPVRLPLKFRAVPVYDLAPVPADREIRLFPLAQAAGGATHPVDAAHYYMNPGTYAGMDQEAIYAHEYGHLLGLSDEYSHSNPQMHALLHGIDPGTADERGKAMDRESVRKMVLAALTRPLMDRVTASTNEIARAFTAGRAPVVTALGTSLRAALRDASVKSMLGLNVPPAVAALAPQVPGMIDAAVAATDTRTLASRIVSTEFGAGPMGALVRRLYYSALSNAAKGSVDLGGINMSINIEGNAGIDAAGNAVVAPTGLWGGGGAPAADIGAAVDRAAGALRTGRVPPVRASGSVLRELSALPGAWAGLPAAAPTSLAGGTLIADINGAMLRAWLARVASAAPAPTPIARRRALARAASGTVRSAAEAAATNAIRAFLDAELQPIMRNSTTALMAAIGDEVTRIMGTPANQLALTSTRDPAIASLASTMHTQLQAQITAAKAAQTAAAGSTAVNPGTTAPAQPVTYSTVNMMSDNTDIFRPDQFTQLATLFNTTAGLKKDREGDFQIEMGAR